MSYYYANKRRSIYVDATPTKTDQAGANQSDINIIVGQQLVTGYAPGSPKPPMYEDFTQFPTDLREMLETSRKTKELRARLPKELREKPLEELLTLTTDAITRIITPPPDPEAPIP